MASNSIKKPMRLVSLATADAASLFYCAVVFMALIMLMISFSGEKYSFTADDDHELFVGWRGSNQLFMNWRPCKEIYVGGQGETVHTIGEKFGDPFIVEQNPPYS